MLQVCLYSNKQTLLSGLAFQYSPSFYLSNNNTLTYRERKRLFFMTKYLRMALLYSRSRTIDKHPLFDCVIVLRVQLQYVFRNLFLPRIIYHYITRYCYYILIGGLNKIGFGLLLGAEEWSHRNIIINEHIIQKYDMKMCSNAD